MTGPSMKLTIAQNIRKSMMLMRHLLRPVRAHLPAAAKGQDGCRTQPHGHRSHDGSQAHLRPKSQARD